MNVYGKVLDFIKNTQCADTIFADVRAILSKASDWDYPEDYQIKRLQREVEQRYVELGGEL